MPDGGGGIIWGRAGGLYPGPGQGRDGTACKRVLVCSVFRAVFPENLAGYMIDVRRGYADGLMPV